MIVPFIFLACMTLISALGVVLSRNVVHSALFMSGSFLGVAGRTAASRLKSSTDRSEALNVVSVTHPPESAGDFHLK